MSERNRSVLDLAGDPAGQAWLAEVDVETLSVEETRKLVQALRIYQIELASQNDELRDIQGSLQLSQEALLESEERYRDLYDFAPVAYLTLDLGGTIRAANLSAARLLEVTRDALVGRKFSDFVSAPDQDRWHLERTRLATEPSGSTLVEIEIQRPGKAKPFHAELALEVDERDPSPSSEIRVAALDVSNRRQLETGLRAAAARELLADQNERRQLAEELHGGIEQGLAIAGLKLGALRERHRLDELDELIDSIKVLSRDLEDFGVKIFPTAIHDVGLSAAAQWLAEDFERKTGLTIAVEDGDEIDSTDELTRILVFVTLRELLRNIVLHSGARAARVRVFREGWHVFLEVTDAGKGFDLEAETEGLGLLNLRERLQHFGGRLEIRSGPGRGTRICANIPLVMDEAQRKRLFP